MKKIIALAGSLRLNSSSHLVLQHIERLIPDSVKFEVYDNIGILPHFNDAIETPEAVIDFRQRIKQSDLVLICTPEYAFGIPGSLKNALDWTVSSGEFVDKPVALVTASSQGEKGHSALLLVLSAISAHVIPDATLLIQFVRAKLDEQGVVKDEPTKQELKNVVENIIKVLQ